MTSLKGISLVKTTCVVLDYDGTLVYVEDVQPTYAAVVALPEQPDTRKNDSLAFVAGSIKAKRISPFSTPAKTVSGADLSDKNREFIATLDDLRATKGPNFVFGKVEAPVSVKKVKASDVEDPTGAAKPRRGKMSREEKQAARRAKRAAAKGSAPQVEEVDNATGAGKARPSASNGAQVYTLVSEDLTTARAHDSQGPKWAEGNRFHRVFLALASLPGKAGTFEDIVGAMCSDGGKTPADPVKVTRRALQQMQSPAFGSLVTVA